METVCLWIILISGLAGVGYVVPTSVDSFSPILEDDARGDCQLDPDSICPLGYLQEIRSRLTCNFDGRQADPSPPGPAAFRLLPVCHEGPVVNGAPWINAAFYKYQFERTDKKGQANEVQNGAAAVISKCLRNNINYNSSTSAAAAMLIDPVQATASFQTGTTVSDGSCTKFHLSFWCRLHGVIKVADKTDPNRFYLEVRLHRLTTSGLFEKDGRLIWGNATDYASIESDSWTEVRRSFFESETFSIVFFAHHNNNCSAFVQTIGLDEVETRADKKECVTTPAPTTEPPTTNLPTTDPPTTDPSTTNPPTTGPPMSDTSTSNPPTTDPPTTDPPTTDPPTCEMGYVQDNVSKSCRCPLSHFESSTGNSGTELPCTEYPVLVNVHISMQTTFDAALADPYTQNFKDLSKSVSAWAKSNFATVLSNITGQVVDLSDIDAVVIEFRNGSIIADILLRSRKTVSVTNKELRLKIDEMAEGLPDSIEISGAPVPITVQTVPFDRCVVEGQSFCFPTATTKCVFDAQTEESSCQCLPGSSWVPGETRSCWSTSASDSDTPWELIYILSGVGGAIIVVLLGIFCFLTQRRRAAATKHAQLDQGHIRTAAIELPENAYDEVGYRRFSRLRGVEQKTPFRDGPVYPVSMMTEVDDDPDYSISGHSRDGSSVIESSSGVGSFGNPYSDESLRDRFAPPPRRGYGRTVGGPSAPYYGPKLPPPDYE